MKRLPLFAVCIVAVCGCMQRATYEIDFSRSPGFEWDGKLRITKESLVRFGAPAVLREDWKVKRIELVGRDGRVASVDADGYRDVPVATMSLDAPVGLRLLGTRRLFHSRGHIAALNDESTRHEETAGAPSWTAPVPRRIRAVPEDMKPFADHAEQLTLADWWAIALQDAERVTMRFDVPQEDLRITVQGRPGADGPTLIEARTGAGALLRRFEQEQVTVQPIDPEDASPASPEPLGPLPPAAGQSSTTRPPG